MNNLDRAKELRNKCARNIGDYCDDCKQEAKQLKEKVEKGCGKSDWVEEYVWLDCDNNYKCKDCQETLKILNEILGEGE